MKKLNNLKIGSLKIGISPQLGISYLTKIIVKFKKKYPGIKFEITSKSSAEMLEMLENRNLDLIIDTLPINSKKKISKVVISKKKNYFVFNKKLNPKIIINKLEDLTKYDLLLPSYDTSMRNKLDEYLESKEVKLNPLIEVDNSEMLLNMVINGLGIGYLDEDLIRTHNDNLDLEIIDLEDELPVGDICYVYMDDFLTTATKKFIDILNKEKE